MGCCLLYCLCGINNVIHIYQFAFELLYLFPDVVVVSDLNKNIGGSTDWRKKDTDWRIYPPPIPLLVSQSKKVKSYRPPTSFQR